MTGLRAVSRMTEAIGGTPVVRLDVGDDQADVWVKVEGGNPTAPTRTAWPCRWSFSAEKLSTMRALGAELTVIPSDGTITRELIETRRRASSRSSPRRAPC